MLLEGQPKRTSYAEIILAVKARLVLKSGLPTDRIKIISGREATQVPILQAEKMLFIRPGRWRTPRSERDGEGRVAARVYRYLQVLVVDRSSLDPVDEDTIHLTDSTYGIIPLEEVVLDVLDMCDLFDSSLNLLLFEPMRMMSGTEELPLRKPFWADAILQFEVGFLENQTNVFANNGTF